MVRINLLHCTVGRGEPLPYITTKNTPACGGEHLSLEGLLGGEEGLH